MNIIAPDTGKILFDGKPIEEKDKERIGYLPEERGLYKKTKVNDMLMYLGELIAIAEPDVLRASLPGILVQIECDPIDRAQAILDAMPETLEASVHGALLHITLADARFLKKVIRNLARNQIQVSQIEEVQPSLEDVFIALVSEYRLKAEQDSDVNG